MIFLPAEENVSTQPTVVATGEDLQHSPLPVAHHVELGQGHVRADLHRACLAVPLVDNVFTKSDYY